MLRFCLITPAWLSLLKHRWAKQNPVWKVLDREGKRQTGKREKGRSVLRMLPVLWLAVIYSSPSSANLLPGYTDHQLWMCVCVNVRKSIWGWNTKAYYTDTLIFKCWVNYTKAIQSSHVDVCLYCGYCISQFNHPANKTCINMECINNKYEVKWINIQVFHIAWLFLLLLATIMHSLKTHVY